MKNKILFLAIGLIIIAAKAVLAEEVELGKIVVTPSRVESQWWEDNFRNTDVITCEDIEMSGAQDLSQALTDITSMNISSYGGLGSSKTIRMRGSTAAQVLVLLDGRPINNPRDGEIDLSTIPLNNIDRIEIVHGPSSSLYGAGAMGGTINIVSKKPPQDKQETEITSSLGSFRTYIQQLSHGGRISHLGYLFTGGYETSEGFRDNTKFNGKNLNAKFEYALTSCNALTLNSGFYRSKVGAPGTLSSPDIDDKQTNFKDFVDFNWDFKPTVNTGISARAYQNYDRLEFMENTAGSIWDTAFKKDVHTTRARGLELQLNGRFLEKYLFVTGVNYVKNMNKSTNSGNHKYNLRAGYLESQIDFSKSLTSNLSARLDDYSNFGSEFNPSANFLYKWRENLKLHGSISRSFRAPTFNDLYWPDEGWIKGNANLRPEKGVTKEIGLETQYGKKITAGINLYESRYRDLINWADVAGVYQPINVNSALINGLEFSNKIYLMPKIELNIGYTLLRAKDRQTHKYLVYQPKNKFTLSAGYRAANGLSVEIKNQIRDKAFADVNNTIKVKGFSTTDLLLSFKTKKNKTYFIYFYNLFNKKYQIIYDYPLPGFSVTSGVKIEF